MDFWTFVIILVIIGAFKNVLKRKYQTSRPVAAGKGIDREIYDLKLRIEELESLSNIKRIEKRIQVLETIVTDSDYYLERKFRKVLREDTDSNRGIKSI